MRPFRSGQRTFRATLGSGRPRTGPPSGRAVLGPGRPRVGPPGLSDIRTRGFQVCSTTARVTSSHCRDPAENSKTAVMTVSFSAAAS